MIRKDRQSGPASCPFHWRCGLARSSLSPCAENGVKEERSVDVNYENFVNDIRVAMSCY